MFRKERQELEKAPTLSGFDPKYYVSPFSMMRRLSDEMDRLLTDIGFNQMLFPLGTEFERAKWVPPIEVVEKEGQLLIRVDLPGLTKEDVKVELTKELLTVTGERKSSKEEKKESVYRAERTYGTFFRSIPLPEGVGWEKAKATFVNGVLEVSVPIPVALQPEKRLLTIEGGEEKPTGKTVAA